MRGTLPLTLLIGLVAAPAALANPLTTLDNGKGSASFETREQTPDASPCAPAPCRAVLTVTRAGATVLSKSFPVDAAGSDTSEYYWSCKRPGPHTWSATFTTAAGAPLPGSSGSFTVAGCRPRGPEKVGRSKAARAAARKVGGKILRTSCSSRPKRGRSRAASWICRVTRRSGARRCTTKVGLNYLQQTDFGVTRHIARVRRGSSVCRPA